MSLVSLYTHPLKRIRRCKRTLKLDSGDVAGRRTDTHTHRHTQEGTLAPTPQRESPISLQLDLTRVDSAELQRRNPRTSRTGQREGLLKREGDCRDTKSSSSHGRPNKTVCLTSPNTVESCGEIVEPCGFTVQKGSSLGLPLSVSVSLSLCFCLSVRLSLCLCLSVSQTEI